MMYVVVVVVVVHTIRTSLGMIHCHKGGDKGGVLFDPFCARCCFFFGSASASCLSSRDFIDLLVTLLACYDVTSPLLGLIRNTLK
jgi:hypothetical protein